MLVRNMFTGGYSTEDIRNDVDHIRSVKKTIDKGHIDFFNKTTESIYFSKVKMYI